MNNTIACIVVTCLHVVSQPSLAHSGGTDSRGCHVESATGQRHCHAPKNDAGKNDDRSDWETAGIATGIAIGGLLVLALVYRWLKDDDADSAFAAADSDPSDLGIRINADESGAQSVGVFWRHDW